MTRNEGIKNGEYLVVEIGETREHREKFLTFVHHSSPAGDTETLELGIPVGTGE